MRVLAPKSPLRLAAIAVLLAACGSDPKPPPAPYVPPMPIDQPPPAAVQRPDAAVPAPVVEKPVGHRCFVYMAREEARQELAVDEANRFVKEVQDRLVITVQPWFIGGKTPAENREPLCRQRATDMCATAKVATTLCRYEVKEGDAGGWTDATQF